MRAMHENIRAHTHAPIPEYEGAPEEATPFNMHNNVSLELLHEPGHKFVIKVGSAWDKNSRQDPQQVCGVSSAYECQHLESASLKQWPALYKIDPDLQISGKGKVIIKVGLFPASRATMENRDSGCTVAFTERIGQGACIKGNA